MAISKWSRFTFSIQSAHKASCLRYAKGSSPLGQFGGPVSILILGSFRWADPVSTAISQTFVQPLQRTVSVVTNRKFGE